jgi:hypothetical protein
MHISEILLESKKLVLAAIDSFTAGTVFIATALSLDNLDIIYKIIMIAVGTLLFLRGFINYQKSKLDKKIKEYEQILEKTEI